MIFFHISAQNIDCGYQLEPPRRGGSNEYPQSMFLSRNMKKNAYPCKPQFYYIKVGFKGVNIIQACSRDGQFIKEMYDLGLRICSNIICLDVKVKYSINIYKSYCRDLMQYNLSDKTVSFYERIKTYITHLNIPIQLLNQILKTPFSDVYT